MLPAISPKEEEMAVGDKLQAGKYTEVLCRESRKTLGYVADLDRWENYPQIARDILRHSVEERDRVRYLITTLEALQLIEADIMHPAMSLGESDAANQTG